MFNIENFLDLSEYTTDTRLSRRKNNKEGKNTAEFFTPYSIVKKMCEKISDEDWSDPDKTFLEPAAGNFQFGCYIIWNRIMHGIDWQTSLETLYSVELMQDNVDESKARVLDMFDKMGISYNEQTAREIMDRNFVCHDFFTWNFKEWRPYTDEEIKQLKKKK